MWLFAKPTFVNRLRGRTWPILQTALAATTAWYAAVLLLPDGRPSFASIAAVICLGASYGQRGSKALQLIAGVVLGITVASVLVAFIGTGALQIGLMVVLAMSAAVLLRGGELLVAESAVSAILLVSLDPNTSDASFTLNRILEALMRHPKWILSRDAIIESIWGFDFPESSNVIEVYVGRIRRKLAEHEAPPLIQTVRGAGYRLREPDA